jgi:hypothetical protein
MTRKYVYRPYTPVGLAVAQYMRGIGVPHVEFARLVGVNRFDLSKIMYGHCKLTARSANLLISRVGEFLRPALVETMLEQQPTHPLCVEILRLRKELSK